MFKIRESFAAGVLYEKNAELLRGQIGGCFSHALGPKGMKPQKIIAGIAPHNSMNSSGPVAAWLYSRLENANFIILGAGHNPMNSQFAMMKEGLWKTPFGEVSVDAKMAGKISDLSSLVNYDILPHQTEHSIEVQLPFLQYILGNDFKFVPIIVFNQFVDEGFLNNCISVGNAIADAIKSSKGNWVLIASSDFSHDKKSDNKIIKSALKLDERKFFDKIKETGTSICGFGCIATAIVAAKKLGGESTKLLKYASASEVAKTGASTGYASIIIY